MELTVIEQDRARGVLLGTAVGDALGAGYEFGYPSNETAIAMIGGGAFDWAPGGMDRRHLDGALRRACTRAGR
ncbi:MULTISPECIES: ADP-ribosylglycohydrolase family protein [unclassified Rhodococcus (in: high G+C Gram-positive bacteria)]|uniref:ADP-ribosylglycohydrolase family protein n=1 Tax=unclassified Rhodococcus (in: high G+C Gram-positive bacteria) TaxID=192944 RepID=UPI0026A5E8A8